MTINVQTAELPKAGPASQKIVSADGTVRYAENNIVCEHFFNVTVNEKEVARLVCTPTHLVELALGRLLTEGLLSCGEDVESVYICPTGGTAKVFLREGIALTKALLPRETACCTGNRTLLQNAAQVPLSRLKKSEWKAEWIFELANVFAGDSILHRETKGTHSCYLSVDGECVFRSEDIGRHNALDKCVGYAVRNGIDRSRCILFTTGRVPTDMVQKSVAAGIPVLVSKAVPTDAAVAMAAEYNMTLICKAWPDSYVIFYEAV